jgi:hypothetical protein
MRSRTVQHKTTSHALLHRSLHALSGWMDGWTVHRTMRSRRASRRPSMPRWRSRGPAASASTSRCACPPQLHTACERWPRRRASAHKSAQEPRAVGRSGAPVAARGVEGDADGREPLEARSGRTSEREALLFGSRYSVRYCRKVYGLLGRRSAVSCERVTSEDHGLSMERTALRRGIILDAQKMCRDLRSPRSASGLRLRGACVTQMCKCARRG